MQHTDVAKGGQSIQQASRNMRQEWREARDRNDRELAAARAECANVAGSERGTGIDRAQERYSEGMNEARRTYPYGSRAAQSDQERAEDLYDQARERCEALRGDAEDRCMADARTRYRPM